ncbi:DUF6511 domain-containing protein [Methylobacterium sp. WL19]|uniref:DUF6511 domain-containing protein n=1 Tax=Methylobacterium sp. WL19 TaxID=2603896 RepID=UPI0011CAE81A|nr:DUF6511 domain-containing protein [Methylobacterium sp. WL19]TXN33919.1 hypothetical protein FV220_00275 [Methylobacterium sp. WL19]
MTRPLDNPGSCFVCRRSASGFGVHRGEQVGWMCLTCRDTRSGVIAMSILTQTFDQYERDALIYAGNEAGEYLDSLGTTDLSALPPENYQRFLEIVVNSFGEGMRHSLKDAA